MMFYLCSVFSTCLFLLEVSEKMSMHQSVRNYIYSSGTALTLIRFLKIIASFSVFDLFKICLK